VFTTHWKTSERRYGIEVERDVRIPVRDGTILVGDIFRPDAPGRFPVILGCHPYNNELQTAPLKPIGYGNLRGYLESGDPAFYVRRGYVQAIVNVRGTGKSQGKMQMMGPLEALDVSDVIEWLEQGHRRFRESIARLDDGELLRPRPVNWGETKETRWIIRVMIEHDLYHAGEINHIRSLRQGNDRWAWEQG